MQLNHYNTNFKSKLFPVTVICDNVTNAPNLGSLFRICDAFGVAQIIFCGEFIPLGRKMTKTSRSTEKIVNYSIQGNILDTVQKLKSENNYLVALEIVSKSESIQNFEFPTNRSITLIVGDENHGISEAILNMCDVIVHIPMYGRNSSMNVVQATNIALYEITKQLV